MNTSTTPFGPDFVNDMVIRTLQSVDEGTKWAYHLFWDSLISFLSEHWLTVISFLVLLFLVALIRAYMGRWGMLGSVLYHYLYFGILFLVGLIKGPEVFVSEYFEIACEIILYPICYKTVGIILDKLGVRRRFG